MILLRNCFHVVTMDEERVPGPALENVDILIRGGEIESVGPAIPLPEAEPCEILDCSHHVVTPGFVNTHHHFFQTLTRNIPAVQNAKLFDWLVCLYEVWKHIDAEAVRCSSLLAMGELLKTGCTCSTDHHYLYPAGFSGDLMALQFEAASRLGMRFSPTRGSMSRSRKDGGLPPDSVVQNESQILADSQRVIETFHEAAERSMRRVILAPCSPFSVTKDLMTESAALARQYGVRLHTHLAETRDEDDYCRQTLGKRPLSVMEDWDFIGQDVSFAHGIHFNDAELDRLAATGTSIAHCPTSNMRLGSGIARVREMLDKGINVALAVDGSASNDSSDFLGEMRNAMLLQRVRYGAAGLDAREVFSMGITNGARLLGFDKIGKIKAGWAADLAVFDIGRIEYAGSLSDPQAALIFAGYHHGTQFTIVDGRLAVRDGRLTGIDEDEVAAKANEISRDLLR